MTKTAICQAPPLLLDREGSIDRAVKSIDDAAGQGAQLILFPETFLPGYPTWLWRMRPGSDGKLGREIYARLLDQSIDLTQNQMAPLREAARRNGVTVSIGLHEREGQYSRSTLFNTQLLIGPDGEVLNRHRKLMPTNPERMIWGQGDADGLRVVDTPVGRIGMLICWENFMPLARYSLYAQGIEILLAPTWDSGEGWAGSMAHIAREGRCYVLSCATALQAKDIPEDFPGRDELFPDPEEWVNPGDAVVVEPGGKLLHGPHHQQKSILFADIDASTVAAARQNLDVAGHYARPDIFHLRIQSAQRPPASWEWDGRKE